MNGEINWGIFMLKNTERQLALDLTDVIHFFHRKNWSPATSTNYSIRENSSERILISSSGIDKGLFKAEDLMLIDLSGKKIDQNDARKTSAETDIHLFLYQAFPSINCVLHTHSPLGTLLSRDFEKEKKISFEGWEILKGLQGNLTHDMTEILPIVSNSQDMKKIIHDYQQLMSARDHGFLISGHGLYSWGSNLSEAKRHIETIEFLFELLHLSRGRYGHFKTT